jgi:hypothetical protein
MPSAGGPTTFTIRLPTVCSSWLYGLASETDKSLADLITGVLDDARTWWGLGEQVAEILRKDAEKRGMTQRDYMLSLLRERSEAVQKHGPGWEKDDPEVLLSDRR